MHWGSLAHALARHERRLAGAGATATGAANNTHPIKPSSTIIPIKSYYGTMLRQSSESPFRVQHLELSAHRLVQSGPCVYNTTAIRPFPIDPIESVEYIPNRPAKPWRPHHPHVYPESKIISNPSMNFQPILEQIGDKLPALSASLQADGTSRITINLYHNRYLETTQRSSVAKEVWYWKCSLLQLFSLAIFH